MDFIERNDKGYKRLREVVEGEKGYDRTKQYDPLLVNATWFGVCKVCAAAIPVSIDKDDTLALHAARHAPKLKD